jgi:hypothetical protein
MQDTTVNTIYIDIHNTHIYYWYGIYIIAGEEEGLLRQRGGKESLQRVG